MSETIKVLGIESAPYVDKLHVLDCIANARGRMTRKEVESAERKLAKMIRTGSARKVTVITTHHFADGMYGREIFIPAGTFATGGIHKTEHLNVLSSGELYVLTEDGIKHMKAPATFVSRAGMKRIGYAITDVVWTTFHPNPANETDFFTMEAALYEGMDKQRTLTPVIP